MIVEKGNETKASQFWNTHYKNSKSNTAQQRKIRPSYRNTQLLHSTYFTVLLHNGEVLTCNKLPLFPWPQIKVNLQLANNLHSPMYMLLFSLRWWPLNGAETFSALKIQMLLCLMVKCTLFLGRTPDSQPPHYMEVRVQVYATPFYSSSRTTGAHSIGNLRHKITSPDGIQTRIVQPVD